MRGNSLFLLFLASTMVCRSQVGIPVTAQDNLHVFASRAKWLGSQYGITVTGTINGQTLVLHAYKDVNPLQPGDYKVRLIKESKPHGVELDRRYVMIMPDGKELTFELEALCGSTVHVCYGVSVDGS